MITAKDLVFTRINPKSAPQWSVSIGGREVAEVIERPISLPRYRVTGSALDDRFFAERKEVIEFLITLLSCDAI